MKTPKLGAIKGEKAQAAVEFALTIPIVLVIVLAIIESGWFLFTYTSLTAAGREAARYGAGVGDTGGTVLYNDCDGIKSAAIRIGRYAGIQTGDVHIYHDSGPNTTQTEYCTTPGDTASFVQDDRIVVKIDVTYSPITPLDVIPAIPLHSQSAHSVVLGAQVVAATPAFSGGSELCDLSGYAVASESSVLGPVDTIVIQNTSGTDTSIENVSIVWDTTSGPTLNQIKDNTIGTTLNLNSSEGAGPTYSWNPSPAFSFPTNPPGSNPSFTLTFSKTLKSNVIIRLTLAGADQCVFGQ